MSQGGSYTNLVVQFSQLFDLQEALYRSSIGLSQEPYRCLMCILYDKIRTKMKRQRSPPGDPPCKSKDFKFISTSIALKARFPSSRALRFFFFLSLLGFLSLFLEFLDSKILRYLISKYLIVLKL